MTGAIVGVLLLTVNPIGDRSIWSGCEMMRHHPGRVAGFGGGNFSFLPDPL
jgi:hypothetical protein